MAGDLKHLGLQPYGEPFQRKIPRRRGYKNADRDSREFAESQAARLDGIGKNRGPMPEFKGYDQRLVFKIRTRQRVDDDRFRRDLERAGCDTIASAPGEEAEWIVATDDAGFEKLREHLRKRAGRRTANFVDAIGGFAEFGAGDKMGEQLAAQPPERNAAEKLVVSLARTRPDRGDDSLNAALALIRRLASGRGLAVHDELIAKNLCLVLLDADRALLDLLVRIDAVAWVDRPPSIRLDGAALA